jgi:hypothetical protein
MGCSHAQTCPLFPRLNDSLAGWKSAYCETEHKWSECARYETSLSGKPVPLALLPNGKVLGVAQTAEETAKPFTPVLVTRSEGGGVAVLTDKQAEVALEEAASGGGFFSRLKSFFGGPK